LIEISKKYTSKIVFVGFNACDEDKVDPIPWVSEWSYKNKLIKEFNDKAKEICEKENLGFLDIYDKLGKEALFDGVHPNSKGHEVIFENVKEFLIKGKIV